MVNISRNFLTQAQFNNPTARTQNTGSNIASPNANNRRTQVGQLPTMKLGGTEGTKPTNGMQIKKDYGSPENPLTADEWADKIKDFKEGDVVYVRFDDGIHQITYGEKTGMGRSFREKVIV